MYAAGKGRTEGWHMCTGVGARWRIAGVTHWCLQGMVLETAQLAYVLQDVGCCSHRIGGTVPAWVMCVGTCVHEPSSPTHLDTLSASAATPHSSC